MLDKTLLTILDWIASWWFPNIPLEVRNNSLRSFVVLVQRWMSSNGIPHTIKRIKLIRLIVTRYLCGQPLMVNDLMIGVTKDGFPSSILFFKELIDSGDPQAIRFVLTCLGISRAISIEARANYDSITMPFKGTQKSLPKDFINLFVRDFTLPYEAKDVLVSDFFLSMKSGPLGGPAILASHLATRLYTGANLWALSTLLGSEPMRWFKDLFLKTGTVDAKKVLRNHKGDLVTCKVANRRLHVIQDPEMKARVIAIFDYISQVAFDSWSKYLFKVLSTIPQDRTFTQDPVIVDKKDGHSFHSLDLSSATDRFPIDLQVDLLDAIERASCIPYRGRAKAWRALMINEPFLTPEGQLIKYAVGQPMGARSSWAAFTLSHHLVVQYAAYKAGQYPFKEYVLLGDDVVIYHDQVATEYKTILDTLGVDCSEQKSHVSINTYEFAKRWFRNGIEVSPVPLKGFSAVAKNPILLYQIVYDLYTKCRGPRTIASSVDVTLDLLKRLRFSKSQIQYYRRTFEDIKLVLRIFSEFPDYELLRRFLAKHSVVNGWPQPLGEAALMKEFIRTSSGVVNGMVMGVTHKLLKFYNEFKSEFPTFITNSARVADGNLDLFPNHPLTFALYTNISNNWIGNKALNYTEDLKKQLTTVTLIDLDKLRLHSRLSEDMVFTYRTFGRKVAYQLSTDPDLIIAKAQSMRFAKSLFDIKRSFDKDLQLLQTGMLVEPLAQPSLDDFDYD